MNYVPWTLIFCCIYLVKVEFICLLRKTGSGTHRTEYAGHDESCSTSGLEKLPAVLTWPPLIPASISYLFPSKSSGIVPWIGDIVERILSRRQGPWHWICSSFLHWGPYLIIFYLAWCMPARWILRDCNRLRLRWWGQKWLILQYFSLRNYFSWRLPPWSRKANNAAKLW